MKTRVVVAETDLNERAYAMSKGFKVYFIPDGCTLHGSIVEAMRDAGACFGLAPVKTTKIKGGSDPAKTCLGFIFKRGVGDRTMRDVSTVILEFALNGVEFNVSTELREIVSVMTPQKHFISRKALDKLMSPAELYR